MTEEDTKEKSNFLPKLWRAATSVPVLTLGFLFLCEVLLRVGNPVDALGFRSADVWNLGPRIELVRKTCPEVALIGSSLLLVLNQDESGTHFYTGNYPPYFQDLLSKAAGDKIGCVNLCSGMQSVPEAYLITEAIAAGKCYPKVIIYGIGLREFIDFVFAAEWNGECFNSVAAYAPADIRLFSNLFTPRTANEFFLSHYFYLYRNRNDLRNMLNAITKDALEYLPLAKSFNRIGPNHQFEAQRQGYLYETWLPKRMEKFGEEIYRSNPDFLHTYYKRYWVTMFERLKLDPRMLTANVQIEGHYLQKLAKLCEEKSIILVVVNMPISKEFQDLAPPGLYDSYRALLRDVSNVTSGHGGPASIVDAASAGEDNYILLDYLNDPDFDDKSFKDGVHLSYEGAKKLAEKLTSAFQKDHPEIIRVIERQHRKMHDSQGGE